MSQKIPEVTRKEYYSALTGIRAIAATLVFFHHFNPFEKGNPTSPRLPKIVLVEWLRCFVEQWHIGVSIFFVLSGFLIATRYMDKIEPSLHWAKLYLQNRFARIYPLYLLVTILTVAFWYSGFAGYHLLYTTGSNFTLKEYIVAFILNITLLRGFFFRIFIHWCPYSLEPDSGGVFLYFRTIYYTWTKKTCVPVCLLPGYAIRYWCVACNDCFLFFFLGVWLYEGHKVYA